MKRSRPVGSREIEGETFLVCVQIPKCRTARSVAPRTCPAKTIALRRFDLDDPRTEFRQQSPCNRAGTPAVRDLDDERIFDASGFAHATLPYLTMNKVSRREAGQAYA